MQSKMSPHGFILALSILLVLGVSSITVGTLYNNKMGKMSAMNYKHKVQTYMASDGVMTMLAQEVINGNSEKYNDTTTYGEIDGKKFQNITGSKVIDLLDAIKNGATYVPIKSQYLGSSITENNYGIVWTGYVVPPISGNYIFYLRSDDASEFKLSTNDSPDKLPTGPNCYEDNSSYSYNTSGKTVSQPVNLIAGNRYYFQYIHKQNNNTGFGQVGWTGPEGFFEKPISGRYLSSLTAPAGKAYETTKLGGIKVNYKVTENGINKFRIFTEAVDYAKGKSNEINFRMPLVQEIRLAGTGSNLGPTVNIPVIYYDFHACNNCGEYWNAINSEFEAPFGWFAGGVIKNMIRDTLTRFTTIDAKYFGRLSIPKPEKNVIANNRMMGLNYWFTDSLPSMDTVWRYKDATKGLWYIVPDLKVPRTKVYSSIPFSLLESQGHGVYRFSRLGNVLTGAAESENAGDTEEFFPLDSLGEDPVDASSFVNPNHHNFGFCLELHSTFQYQSGLIFEFTGDDDTWAFVNNKQIVDLGGVHEGRGSFVMLDEVPGLQVGKTYPFDFFECERHTPRSQCRITTNLFKSNAGGPVSSKSWKRDYGALD